MEAWVGGRQEADVAEVREVNGLVGGRLAAEMAGVADPFNHPKMKIASLVNHGQAQLLESRSKFKIVFALFNRDCS